MTTDPSPTDRTSEFYCCIRSFQQWAYYNQGRSKLKSKQPKRVSQHTSLLTAIKSLSTDLNGTRIKLKKLNLLTSPSVSNTESRQSSIDQLIDIIKSDIADLSNAFQRLGNTGLAGYSQSASHYKLVLIGLEQALKSTFVEFRRLLETIEQDRLKESSVPASHCSTPPPSSIASGYHQSNSTHHLPPFPPPPDPHLRPNGGQHSPVFTQAQSPSRNNTPPYYNKVNSIPPDFVVSPSATVTHRASSSSSVSVPLIEPNHHQQQLFIVPDQQVRQRDAAGLQSVESTIVQLGELYQQFSSLVNLQSETVERIDSFTETAELNVSAAHVELMRFLNSVSQRRAFLFKLFGTLIVCFVLFSWFKS